MRFSVMVDKNPVRVVCLIGVALIFSGCANFGKARYEAKVGECSSILSFSTFNSSIPIKRSIPNTLTFIASNFGGTEIKDATASFGGYHIFLTDTGRIELIELMNKSIEWAGIAKNNSIETNRAVGTVSSALNAYHISSSLISSDGVQNISVLMSLHGYSTTNVLSIQEALCFRDRLVAVPKFVAKATAMETTGELFK